MQRSRSSFITTSNLCWNFPICWRWKVHRILAEVQDLKIFFFFFLFLSIIYIYGCTGDR